MIRVLHVITRLEPGGAQRNTLYTVAHLDREEFEPGLAWGPGGELDTETQKLNGVSLFEVPGLVRRVAPAADLRAVSGLRRVIRDFGADIVHTHSSKAGILGRAAARLERAPAVIHSIHGWGFTPLQSPLKRALFIAAERRAARWTDHFIAVSEANVAEGRRLGIIGGNCTVIRSGIDLERFRRPADPAPVRRSLAIPNAVPVVVQISNLKPQKAPEDFVRVAAAVAAVVPDVHFVLTGEGPLRGKVEKLAVDLGIAGRLRLPGWWDDVPGLLAAADVFVLSSRHEGLPRAVVEALASGTPVVATAVDGTPEVLRDGVAGYLVGPGEVDDMARRVVTLLENDDLRRTMGHNGPAGLEDWDIDSMVRRQEELYRCVNCRKK